jgi:integrase
MKQRAKISKRRSAAAMPTLEQAWSDYQRTSNITAKTKQNYDTRLRQHLGDWMHLPLDAITRDMVQERHHDLREKGKVIGNYVFKTLRTIYRYAMIKYLDDDGEPVIKSSPTARLTEARAWYKEHRKTRIITNQQLRPWLLSALSYPSDSVGAVLVLMLFTGLRSCEASTLTYSKNIDLQSGIITVHETKNGTEHKVPMSDFVWHLLKQRKAKATTDFVFPGRFGRTPIRISTTGNYQPIIDASGVPFSPHDCRRTFITQGDECDIKSEIVKALVNHKSKDVTERYTIRSMEKLREATQLITDRILMHAGVRKPFLAAVPALQNAPAQPRRRPGRTYSQAARQNTSTDAACVDNALLAAAQALATAATVIAQLSAKRRGTSI